VGGHAAEQPAQHERRGGAQPDQDDRRGDGGDGELHQEEHHRSEFHVYVHDDDALFCIHELTPS